ncbi:hypothetical protein EGW08_004882, partial [Elysia chlorotica]
MSSKAPDETTDALRRRLNTAEQDTQLLMKQLEDLGFSPDAKERRIKLRSDSRNVKSEQRVSASGPQSQGKSSFSEDSERRRQQQHANVKNEQKSSVYASSKNKHLDYREESESESSQHQPESSSQQGSRHSQDDDLDCAEKENQPSSRSGKIFSSKSAKHRPITPLSLRGLTMPGSLQVQEPRNVEDFMPKIRSTEPESQLRQRKEHYEDRKSVSIGRQELEQELIRVKKIVPQLQDELETEITNGEKLRAELERLRASLEEVTTEKTQMELQVEDMASMKQKALRRLAEVKEEAMRESSLRASLEESHSTLLTRLQDMEAVIESLRAEIKSYSTGSGGLKLEVVRLREELSQETMKRQRAESSLQAAV